jgi:hypothetical protein
MSHLPRFKSFSSFHAVPGALRSHPTTDPYMVAYTRTDWAPVTCQSLFKKNALLPSQLTL